MYDWANSAFATSGVAAIFPVYFVFLFKESLGDGSVSFGVPFTASSLWSLGIAVSTASVALTSPILGVIADRAAIKKTLLFVYTSIGSLFTLLTFFSAYTSEPWLWLFAMFFFANIGFAGSLVFYNSFLPHLGTKDVLDDISSKGFAYGYVGGGLLLLMHLGANLFTSGTDHADLVTRLSMASIGIWWFLWSLWTLNTLPEPSVMYEARRITVLSAIRIAIATLRNTFKEITRFKTIAVYLCSYLLFNDGLQTVLGIAGAYAADTLGIPLFFNMTTILIIQFVAAGGAILFGRIATIFTTKTALVISLIGWVIIVLMGVGLTPLAPYHQADYQYQLEFSKDRSMYELTASPNINNSSQNAAWNARTRNLSKGDFISVSAARIFVNHVSTMKNSHSVFLAGGPLDGLEAVGPLHISNLGDGALDWWPSLLRKTIWAPIGLNVGFQWLILGVGVGLVMGGSQALARSLFAQISPHTRSGEFFSFFGFMSRASSVFGPMLYILVTGLLDTRAAVLSIVIIIIAGTIILKWVDVADGTKIASQEDRQIKNTVPHESLS